MAAFIQGDNAAHTHTVHMVHMHTAGVLHVNLTSRLVAKRLPCSFRDDAGIHWDEAAVLSYLSSSYWDPSGEWARHPHRVALDRVTAALADSNAGQGDEHMHGGIRALIGWAVSTIGPYFMYFVAFRMCMVSIVLFTCFSSPTKQQQQQEGEKAEAEEGVSYRLVRWLRGLPSSFRRWARTLGVRLQVACCPSRLLGDAAATASHSIPIPTSTSAPGSAASVSSSLRHGAASSLVRGRGGDSAASTSHGGSSSSSGGGSSSSSSGGSGGLGHGTPKCSHPKDIV